jgi:hypothetical protein
VARKPKEKRGATVPAKRAKISEDGINVSMPSELRRKLEALADELFPGLPGNKSILVRQLITKAVGDHEQRKEAQFNAELDSSVKPKS